MNSLALLKCVWLTHVDLLDCSRPDLLLIFVRGASIYGLCSAAGSHLLIPHTRRAASRPAQVDVSSQLYNNGLDAFVIWLSGAGNESPNMACFRVHSGCVGVMPCLVRSRSRSRRWHFTNTSISASPAPILVPFCTLMPPHSMTKILDTTAPDLPRAPFRGRGHRNAASRALA